MRISMRHSPRCRRSARHVDSFLQSQASLIKEMVVTLMEEANEDAEHKSWCDTEL